MSFPKAKRFNDPKNCTPSPADYTIVNNSHVTGAVIPKSERFSELSSPAHSDVSSHHSSTCNLPVFRTPNLPPKLKPKVKKATSTFKPVDLFQSEDSLDALNEKIVECSNKDQYIKELMEQVEEMKQQLGSCNTQLSHLNEEHTRLAETLSNVTADKEILLNNQQNHFLNVNEQLITVYNTHNKIGDVKTMNFDNKTDLKTLLQNVSILDDLLESYKMINDRNICKLEEKDKDLYNLEKAYLDSQNEYKNKVDVLILKYEGQIKDIRDIQTKTETDLLQQLSEKDKLIEEKTNTLLKLQQTYEFEKNEIQKDREARISQMNENFRDASILAERQFQKTLEDIDFNWQLQVDQAKTEADAILKECQAIAEYNIIQCEVEKNRAIYDLREYKTTFELLGQEHNKLKQEFSTLAKKYEKSLKEVTLIKDSKIKTLTELENCQALIEQMNKDKHKYEVTVVKTHILIETLKNRLMESDNDVEQLKLELEDTESSKLECEGKCNVLEDELEAVLKLFEDFSKEIKTARKENEDRAVHVERELHLKNDINPISTSIADGAGPSGLQHVSMVEQFRIEADAKIVALNNKLSETTCKLDEALHQLEEQQLLNTEAQLVIEHSLKEIEILKECAQCTDTQERYKLLEKQLLQFEQDNAQLLVKISEQESLIGPFREQLMAYESEHRAILNQKQNAEQEAKEMGLKFAQLLGHQNQKQKIKHMMDLKTKNFELSETIKELEAKIRNQARMIEKLKKESVGNTTKIDKKKLVSNKENIQSSPKCIF